MKYPLELGTNQGRYFTIREITHDFLTHWGSGRDEVKLGSTDSRGSVDDYTLLSKQLRWVSFAHESTIVVVAEADSSIMFSV